MNITANEILLHHAAEKEWLYFTNPQCVFIAATPAEVLPALQEIEKLVTSKGLYAAGFLSYEAAPAFDPAFQVNGSPDFPLLWFGLYPPPQKIKLPPPSEEIALSHWEPSISRADYEKAIALVKVHIARGETYQVNFTMGLSTRLKNDPWQLFLNMVQAQTSGYAAYADIGTHVICSASPELFFTKEGQHLTCRPMKGTVKRGRTTSEDSAQSDWLISSEKNRAENVMIVDMIRNDLGRIAEIGSVRVPALFSVERYPTLWQMTSTVTAESQLPFSKILAALFPCASITGAPKVSTMRIIASLENRPRRIYTGSLGFLSPQGYAQFNVAIRTALFNRSTGEAEYGVGGGIVWDSTSQGEYDEALLKAQVLTAPPPPDFSLLETMRWTPAEGFFLLPKHINRLLDSAAYFGFAANRQAIETHLENLAKSFAETPQRVRLLLGTDGAISSESSLLASSNSPPLRARLSRNPIHSENVFLFHKTTHRGVYAQAIEDNDDCEEALLLNEHEELTEFTFGNLIVQQNGKLFTPPLNCGLLAGTMRAHLLETGEISERVIMRKDIEKCEKFFRVNSVRGWQEVHLK